MGQPSSGPSSQEAEIEARISSLQNQLAEVIKGQDDILGGLPPDDTPSEQEQKVLDQLAEDRAAIEGELILENQALEREKGLSGDQLDAWGSEEAGIRTGEELDALDSQAADQASGLTGEELDNSDQLDRTGSDLGQDVEAIVAGPADGGSSPGGGSGGDSGGGGSGGDSGGGGSGGDSGGGGSGGDSGGGGSGGGGGDGGGSGGDGGSGGSGGGTAAAEGADDNPNAPPAMPGGVVADIPGSQQPPTVTGSGVIDPAADNPSGPSGDPLTSG